MGGALSVCGDCGFMLSLDIRGLTGGGGVEFGLLEERETERGESEKGQRGGGREREESEGWTIVNNIQWNLSKTDTTGT